MRANEVGKALELLREINMVAFREFRYYSNRVFEPTQLNSIPYIDIFKCIECSHIEIRNNMCEIHIDYFDECEFNGKKYNKLEIEKFFWEEIMHWKR